MNLELPTWVHDVPLPTAHATREERMRYVLDLAAENVRRRGGPFASAIFNIETGACVGKGVNLVQAYACSILHAEMVAIIEAESAVATYSLSPHGDFELFASAEPCAMCLGAIPWSGVRRVVCAARDEDVRAIGFDEGVKPQPWTEALTSRGIDVVRDVLRSEAISVLNAYTTSGGIIYNG